MSLASLLLDGPATAHRTSQATKHVDKDLDALFRSNPAPPVLPPAHKRNLTVIPSDPPSPIPNQGRKRKRLQEGLQVDAAPIATTPLVETFSAKAHKRKKVQEVVDNSSEDDAEDPQLEDAYLTLQNLRTEPIDRTPSLAGNSSDENDDDAAPPMHETHAGTSSLKRRGKPRKKTKYVPPEETPTQRDARTVFVGNVPVDVAKSKPSQKQLKRHFTSRISGSTIESVRFRSVAFASATSTLPAENGKSVLQRKPDTPSTKQQRQQERAAQWRESESDKSRGVRGNGGNTSDREDNDNGKKPVGLNPGEKKRVAFFKGDFHKEVDTVNAYIVFAHFSPAEGQAETDVNTVHPFEAARLAVERCDGTSFLEHTIRVDRVGKWREGCGSSDTNVDFTGSISDPRKTLFVGNLDFAAKEEELRVWFEGVVSQERGPPGEGESDDEDTQKAWVKGVRIVRDRDTQLGKGFAYVRFADRDCVDEILALTQDKLKFAKRNLRVQRCKVVPGGIATNIHGNPGATRPSKKPSIKPAQTKKSPAPTRMPLGDPTLGSKLASLSKEERKAAKAANVDRVQRRLAKKKIRSELEKVKGKEKMGDMGKTRERERKKSGAGGRKGKTASKGRVRSEKSLEKRNAKK